MELSGLVVGGWNGVVAFGTEWIDSRRMEWFVANVLRSVPGTGKVSIYPIFPVPLQVKHYSFEERLVHKDWFGF